MRKAFIFLALVLITNCAFSTPIDSITAKRLAQTFWETSGCSVKSGNSASNLINLTTQTDFKHLYIFSNTQGFVILSADDCAQPILAYSPTGRFDATHIPAAVNDWLLTYEERIENAVNQNLVATERIATQWRSLRTGEWKSYKGTCSVEPLITAKWGQREPYNAYCPTGTPAGCVAVAMGQVMHYWKHPLHGTGSHSYTYNNITHNVNFANATYDWNAMPDVCSGSNDAVATLIYHCGVATDMEYTPYSSNAYVLNSPNHPINAESALKNFFGYSTNAHGEYRLDYNKEQWISMLKEDLDAGHPIIYNGYNSSYSGGHCFICIGYDANDFFYFNWGLNGYYDGYFEIDDMTPSNQNFSYNQGAILGLVPAQEGEGVDEYAHHTVFKAYPNPTSGIFTLECEYINSNEYLYYIYDEFGKLLFFNSFSQNKCIIDLSDQADGIYLIKLMKNGETIFSQKLIKIE